MPRYDSEDIDFLVAKGDVKELIRALRDVETLELAKTALIDIGEPAVRPLVKALRDGSVSYFASRVLKEIGTPAIKPLIKALGDRSGSGFAAATLEDIGPPAVPGIIEALSKEGERTRILAVRALGVIGDKRAINPIKAEFIENLQTDPNSTLHEVSLKALKDLGVSFKYAEEDEFTLDEFINELLSLGFSKNTRSKSLYSCPNDPDIRFRTKKRIVALESRRRNDDGTREWVRVRSFSVKGELWDALRVAELVVMPTGTS